MIGNEGCCVEFSVAGHDFVVCSEPGRVAFLHGVDSLGRQIYFGADSTTDWTPYFATGRFGVSAHDLRGGGSTLDSELIVSWYWVLAIGAPLAYAWWKLGSRGVFRGFPVSGGEAAETPKQI